MRAIDIKWDTDGDEEITKLKMALTQKHWQMSLQTGCLMRPVFVSLVLFWKQKRIGFVLETEKKDKTKTLKKSRTGLTC